ncbi:MAG TPA: ABC transporter permease [Micromonosporaceae bacterium]|jgi:ABC-2 type transport system permease protein
MNATYLRIEITRLFRNRRALVFSILMPALLLAIFGGLYKNDSLNGAAASAYLMVSMGLFGAMTAAIGSGGTIAVERGIGWNRQLRLTALTPREYATTKVVVALLLALPPLVVTYAIGVLGLGVRLPLHTWLAVAAISWVGALPFAALGLLVGYVAKPDSVQPITGVLYMLLAAFGGIWVPAEQMPDLMRRIAEWTPAYWVGQAARTPLFHTAIQSHAVWSVLAWTAVFALVAVRQFRRATARA